ncbi:MAG TPA: FapA family protein [bacterium]|nr:FapA family protein [bacterium]
MPDKDKPKTEHEELLGELAQFDEKYESSHTAPQGESVAVKVSDDEMKVTVVVQPPLDSDVNLDKDLVLKELEKIGVENGIDEEAIEDIFTYGSYNVEVIVAKGIPSADGTSAKIEYEFDVSEEKKVELKKDEFGNVDHRETNLIESVEEGALLARKIPAIPGEEGVTCMGAKLPAKEGRDIPLPLGENVKATDDGLGVIATISGQPILKDNMVSVSPVFEVKGDVSYKTGNINFKGTVIIQGNVQSDFVVNATDDIEIHGNIEKAYIEAGGDIRISGGLYGSNEGRIVARGSVSIRSIESGIIEAGKNIVIRQQSRSSILMAGEDIILDNAKGSITGGKATCGHHFDLSNLGSQSFTETVVEIGINPKVKELFDTLNKQLEDEKIQFDKVTNHIKVLKTKKKEELSEKEKELLQRIVPAFHKLRASIEAKTAKVNFLREKMDKMSAGRCRIRGKTYPGVKMYTANASMAIRSEVNHSSFFEQNEQIIVGPY